MDALRADRVPIIMARGLKLDMKQYYQIVDESSEEEIPQKRVFKIEHLEPLGVAVQMYCLYLRTLECDYDGSQALMNRAWRTLELTPEVRDDVAALARGLYGQMLAYNVFRANASVLDMVSERCQAIYPQLAEAPELRAYVSTVTERTFNVLQQVTIV